MWPLGKRLSVSEGFPPAQINAEMRALIAQASAAWTPPLYHWLGDWQPYADETDGNVFFWLGEEADRPHPPKPFDPEPEDDGDITLYPKL